MQGSWRPRLLFPGLILLAVLVVAVLPWGSFSSQGFAQTTQQGAPPAAPPVKIVKIGEASRLELRGSFMGRGGFSTASANPGAGRRFVTVELQFAPSVNILDTENLVLVTATDQAFSCEGLGDSDGKYCIHPGYTLERKGESFSGFCVMKSGDAISLGFLNLSSPIAVFSVPASIPPSALELVYTSEADVVRLDPAARADLPNGLTAVVKQVNEAPMPGGNHKLVNVLVDVRNTGQRAFRVHRGTVQLHVPSKPNEKGEISWSWEPPAVGAVDMTGAAEKEQRSAKSLLMLAPGETRTLGLAFPVLKEVDAKRSELGFFREQVFPLAAATPPAPAPKE